MEQAKVDFILGQCSIRPILNKNTGGQSCGVMNTGVEVIHEDLGVSVKVDHYRSQYKNREAAINAFKYIVKENFK